MKGKKKVAYIIEVLEGDYCWDYSRSMDDYHICEYFENEGGWARCLLDFGDTEKTDKGYKKPDKCRNLKDAK